MTQEALKLALEALEESKTNNDTMEFHDRKNKAIAAIKEALAQEQEPVAWQFMNGSTFRKRRPDDFVDLSPDGLPYWKPLYTHSQRTWVGLTDEERKEIALEVPMDAVCITEAKLKDKNCVG